VCIHKLLGSRVKNRLKLKIVKLLIFLTRHGLNFVPIQNKKRKLKLRLVKLRHYLEGYLNTLKIGKTPKKPKKGPKKGILIFVLENGPDMQRLQNRK